MTRSIYPGWIVLAACFTCALLLIGGTIYIFQLFVLPVSEEFGLSRGEMNNGYVAILTGMALWSPFVGRALDRLPARLIMAFGALCYTLAFVGLSYTSSPKLMVILIATLLSLGVCCAGGLAANAVTSRWFQRRRGLALGIASVASSAGGFVMLPIVTGLIESQGWRQALLMTGIGVGFVAAVIALCFVRSAPTSDDKLGFTEFDEDFKKSQTQASNEIESRVWSFAKLMSTPSFWLLSIGIGLLLASDQAILTSLKPHLKGLKLTDTQVTLIITAMPLSAIPGKLIVGKLADNINQRHLFTLVALFHIGLLSILLIEPGFWILLTFVSIFGAAVGGVYPVWSTIASANFGTRSFGTVFGTMSLLMQILAIIFVAFIGRSFDKTGSYHLAFTCFVGAIITAIFIVYFTKKPK